MQANDCPALSALKPGTRCERAFSVQRASVDAAARTVELAFASETPYERFWGVEVLDCAPTSIRMGRLTTGAPLLWNHDTGEQLGVVESVTVGADRVARAVVRFGKSARADEIFTDVVDGVIRNVSVGYLIHLATLVEQASDGPDTYRVTDWEPYEVSLVSVPADPTVGVGRNAEDPRQAPPAAAPAAIQAAAPATPAPNTLEHRTMQAQEVTAAAPGGAPSLNLSAEVAAATAAERTRQRELRALGDQFARFGGKAIADKAIEDGTTVEATRGLIANAMTSAQTENVTRLDMSPNEQRRFSVFKAIRALTSKDWSEAGFERECHTAILKRAGLQEAPHQGFYVPMDVQQRDLTVGAPTAGGNLVGTELRPQNFIDLLRARSVLARLGATMLPGLVGNVAVPKQTGAATAYWLANEATPITESQQTFGQLALAPKTLGAYTELSRLLMLQSTPAAEALVMNDLAKVLALAIDLAGLEGTGASGQPTGIASTAGIGSVTGTTLGYAGIIEFQTDVATGNALSTNSAYLTTPAVAGLLMQRQRFSGTDTPLWDGGVLDGRVAGFTGTTTTQLTAASMIFGDFEQVVIGEWGFLELALNPYANFTAAVTGIRAIQTVDVGVRQAAAFSRATSIT
jgi:HK97 family phage major capsid protein/HK97 family phage prohead protease